MSENKKPDGITKAPEQGRSNKPFIKKTNKTPKFEGRCEELKDIVFDVTDSKQKRAENFTKAIREIANYVAKEFKYGEDTAFIVENLIEPELDNDLPVPPTPTGDPPVRNPTEEAIWKEEIKLFVHRKNTLTLNSKKLYSLVWGQCSDGLKSELEADETYAKMKSDVDPIKLLQAIRGVAHNFKAQVNMVHSLHIAKRTFYHLHQGAGENVPAYYERFKSSIEVIEEMGGSIGVDPALLKHALKNIDPNLNELFATSTQLVTATKQGKDSYLAVAFILGSDRRRYGRYLENLHSDFLQGHDKYPKTLAILLGWKADPRNLIQVPSPNNDGLSFATIAAKDPLIGKDGKPMRFHEGITCYRCGRDGHYSNE